MSKAIPQLWLLYGYFTQVTIFPASVLPCAYNDSDGWFSKVGQIGKKFGLEWGGDWKGTPDKPHFELTKYGTTNTLVNKFGVFENFKKTWKPVEEVKKYMFVNRNYSYNNKIKSFNVINENGENYIKIRRYCTMA